ncbi:MAG: hypothetical protein AAB785_02475 [Patescibacteria group bacterium]
MMEKIDRIINGRSKFKRYKQPLKAARICQAAREVSKGDFEVISFKGGILTCAVSSSGEAASLFQDSEKTAEKINQKIGERAVERIRFKIQ